MTSTFAAILPFTPTYILTYILTYHLGIVPQAHHVSTERLDRQHHGSLQ